MFPKEYRGDAFVALHGSWNREKLTGFKIIRIRFNDGKLVGIGVDGEGFHRRLDADSTGRREVLPHVVGNRSQQ